MLSNLSGGRNLRGKRAGNGLRGEFEAEKGEGNEGKSRIKERFMILGGKSTGNGLNWEIRGCKRRREEGEALNRGEILNFDQNFT